MAWDDDKSTAADPDNPSADEQLTADEWDNHVGAQQRGKVENRVDVTSTSHTAAAQESSWVDTASAGGAVTVTLPADADVADGQRVEVGVSEATNNTDVSANTGQSIIGSNPTLTTAGDTLTFEFKGSNSTWMVR